MVQANYKVIFNGQLRQRKTLEEVVRSTGRWIKFIDKNSKYDIVFFAGLFVKITWYGDEIDFMRVDTMMYYIRKDSPSLFLVSETSINIKYSEKGV